MNDEPRKRSRILSLLGPLLGLSLFVAPAAVFLVQHDLDATQTVGLQSRAQRRSRESGSQAQHKAAARCALGPAKRHTSFEQCVRDERKRDDAFYRPMPKKPRNPE